MSGELRLGCSLSRRLGVVLAKGEAEVEIGPQLGIQASWLCQLGKGGGATNIRAGCPFLVRASEAAQQVAVVKGRWVGGEGGYHLVAALQLRP